MGNEMGLARPHYDHGRKAHYRLSLAGLKAGATEILIPHNPQLTPGAANLMLLQDFRVRSREDRARRQSGWHSQDRPQHV
jgi:hypothetical protein